MTESMKYWPYRLSWKSLLRLLASLARSCLSWPMVEALLGRLWITWGLVELKLRYRSAWVGLLWSFFFFFFASVVSSLVTRTWWKAFARSHCISMMNWVDGLKLLRWQRKSCNHYESCGQTKKVSSKYRSHNDGSCCAESRTNFSKRSIKMLLTMGE
jgi:hypothetical protein